MVNLLKTLGHLKITTLKYNWKSTLLFIDQNPMEKVSYVIRYIFNQICFWNWFWTSGSALTRKRMKVKMQVFFFGHFPRSKISIITYLHKKKILERLNQ